MYHHVVLKWQREVGLGLLLLGLLFLARVGVAVEIISAGESHTCGLKTDGSIICWGDNSSGQAEQPTGNFIQVSAGNRHTCGLKTDGSIICWGSNSFGLATPPSGNFVQVSAGSNYACAIKKDDASIECWGENYQDKATPPAGGGFLQISAGGNHACGVKKSGSVECWGNSGQGRTTPPVWDFIQVSSSKGQTWVGHTCGIKTNGIVECWGYNDDGRITPPAGNFIQIDTGTAHTCGVKTNNSIECWGLKNQVTPPPSGSFTQVSAGNYHACGLKTDGSVECWGENNKGQATPPAGVRFAIPDVEITPDTSTTLTYEEGIQAGKQQCIDNPASCGIQISNTVPSYEEGLEAGKQICINDPAACGIQVSNIEAVKQQCANDPASCGIQVGTCDSTLPEQETNATISGFVRTPEGQGVEGISICASNKAEQHCDWTRTDAEGHFSFSAPNGEYSVFPYSPMGGFIFTPGSGDVVVAGGKPVPEILIFPAEPTKAIPRIYVNTNANQFSRENPNISVSINTDVEGGETAEKPYDVYVAIGVPDAGTPENPLLFHGGKSEFDLTTEITPYLENVLITASDTWDKVFSYAFDTAVKAGSYFIHVGIVDRESGELVAEDHVDVNYDPDYESPFVEDETTTPVVQPEEGIPRPLNSLETVRNLADDDRVRNLNLIAKLVDEQGVQLFKSTKVASKAVDAINTIGEVDGTLALYWDLNNDVIKGTLTDSQRDSLMVVEIISKLLTLSTRGEVLYNGFDSKDLVGGIREVFIALNDHEKTQAVVLSSSSYGNSTFTPTLDFSHEELGLSPFYQGERLLKVKLDNLVAYDGSIRDPKPVSRDKLGEMFSCTFEVESEGQVAIQLPERGIYLVTTADAKDNAIRRKQVFIDGKHWVEIGFNYRDEIYHTLSEWKEFDSETQKFIDSIGKPIETCTQFSSQVQ